MNTENQAPFGSDFHGKRAPTPPSGYTLIRYDVAADGKSGTYTPSMSVGSFNTLKVWIPDLGAWMKPKFIVGDEPRWFAIKQ